MRLQSIKRLHRGQAGQNAFEYLLVAGAVVVALAIALQGLGGVVPEFLGHTCSSVDTAAVPAATDGSCIAEAPTAAPTPAPTP